MKTLASIESFTGGAFAAAVTETPGASEYFKGAIVAYSNEVKEKLGVKTADGVVNAATALALAKAGQAFFNVDTCVAFTGNAGPTALEDLPVGRVYIAINDEVFELDLPGERKQVRALAVEFALQKVGLAK